MVVQVVNSNTEEDIEWYRTQDVRICSISKEVGEPVFSTFTRTLRFQAYPLTPTISGAGGEWSRTSCPFCDRIRAGAKAVAQTKRHRQSRRLSNSHVFRASDSSLVLNVVMCPVLHDTGSHPVPEVSGPEPRAPVGLAAADVMDGS